MKKRILTGDRPTGPLHLGHYFGSLANRVQLQDEFDTYILVADVQALTDNFDNPEKVKENVLEVVKDNLAVGVDPKKATIFLQSAIPEIAELTVFFANLVTVSRLQRNPTVKDEMKQKKMEESLPLGFLMYPVSQAADILVVKANLVPVGEDQVPHIEQTREIARNFNKIYGEVFPEPVARVGEMPRLVGIDGKAKMSKSLGNAIYLKDSTDELKKKINKMYTDPTRIKATDPGHIEGNVVFMYLDIFMKDKGMLDSLKSDYKKGQLGDVVIKEYLFDEINNFLTPIRQKRESISDKDAMEVLRDGTDRASVVTRETMREVRKAMRLL